MKVLILDGPNLNMLGRREPEIYGSRTFESFLPELSRRFPTAELRHVQSNCEGRLIDTLHSALTGESHERADAVILNAGAYTHYSYALADAVKSIAPLPVVEVHISNPAAREEFRRKSVLSPVCLATVSGFGLESYALALQGLLFTCDR